jgi:hypothetical protein
MSDTQDSQSEIESVLQDSAGAEDESVPKTPKGKRPLSAQLIAKGISLLSKTGVSIYLIENRKWSISRIHKA